MARALKIPSRMAIIAVFAQRCHRYDLYVVIALKRENVGFSNLVLTPAFYYSGLLVYPRGAEPPKSLAPRDPRLHMTIIKVFTSETL